MKVVKEVEQNDALEAARKAKIDTLIKGAGDRLMKNENDMIDNCHPGALPDRLREAEKWGKIYGWLMQIKVNRFPPKLEAVPEGPKIIQP